MINLKIKKIYDLWNSNRYGERYVTRNISSKKIFNKKINRNRLKPFRSLKRIYSKHLKSTSIKTYTVKEVDRLTKLFLKKKIQTQLSLARIIYPKILVKVIAKFFLISRCLLIKVEK